MYEVEVKACLENKSAVIKKLESLGCKFGEELHQVDSIFIPIIAPIKLISKKMISATATMQIIFLSPEFPSR